MASLKALREEHKEDILQTSKKHDVDVSMPYTLKDLWGIKDIEIFEDRWLKGKFIYFLINKLHFQILKVILVSRLKNENPIDK